MRFGLLQEAKCANAVSRSNNVSCLCLSEMQNITMTTGEKWCEEYQESEGKGRETRQDGTHCERQPG